MKRVHFPPDRDLADIQDCSVPLINTSYFGCKENIDSSSHLCGKFSSPFRVGGRGAKLLSKAVLAMPSPTAVDGASAGIHGAKSGNHEAFAFCFEEPMCFGLIVSANASQWSIIQPLRPAADPNNNSFVLCNDGHFRTVRKERLFPVEMKSVPTAAAPAGEAAARRTFPNSRSLLCPMQVGAGTGVAVSSSFGGTIAGTVSVNINSSSGGYNSVGNSSTTAWQICWTRELGEVIGRLCVQYSSGDSTPNRSQPNTPEAMNACLDYHHSGGVGRDGRSGSGDSLGSCSPPGPASVYDSVVKNINANMRSVFASCPPQFVPDRSPGAAFANQWYVSVDSSVNVVTPPVIEDAAVDTTSVSGAAEMSTVANSASNTATITVVSPMVAPASSAGESINQDQLSPTGTVPAATATGSFDWLCNETSCNIETLLQRLRQKPLVCTSSTGAGTTSIVTCGVDCSDVGAGIGVLIGVGGADLSEEDACCNRMEAIVRHAGGPGSESEDESLADEDQRRLGLRKRQRVHGGHSSEESQGHTTSGSVRHQNNE